MVLFDSESTGVAGMDSFGSDWTLAEFVRPTKVFEVTSIGLRSMSDPPSKSRSDDADVVEEVSMESSVDSVFKFSMNLCLRFPQLFLMFKGFHPFALLDSFC